MVPRKDISETNVVVPIPVIDARNLANWTEEEFDLKDPKLINLANQIGEALREHGFMYLTNHGIPEELVTDCFEQNRIFYNLPTEVKLKYSKPMENTVADFNGYILPGREQLDINDDSVKEWKEMFDFYPLGRQHDPTDDVPGLMPAVNAIKTACCHFQMKMLRLVALAVGLEDTDYFINRCKNLLDHENHPGRSTIRTVFYPPIPEDLKNTGTWIGCNEHTDWGILTLLWQDDIGGLEVKTATGEWVKATPIPNTIVCNTGGLLELWTGGYLPATFHRVHVKPFKKSELEEEGGLPVARQSFGFFMSPDESALIEPQTSDKMAGKQKPNLKPIMAPDYFDQRAKLAYGQAND